MWTEINSALKSNCPALHCLAKRVAGPLLHGRVKIPVPKRLEGHVVWTQGRLLTSDPPEKHILKWIAQSLPAGGVFFDVGAHYGWMAMAAARKAGRRGRVVAFEASPPLIEVLRYHARVNRLRQVQVVHAAVSDVSAGSVPIFLLNQGLSCRNSITIGAPDVPYVTPQEKLCIQVPSISLDDFALSSGLAPDVIKIDVEGAELLVLDGAEDMLDRFRPTLILASHPYWQPPSRRPEEIFDVLAKHRYRVSQHYAIPFAGGELADYLCLPT